MKKKNIILIGIALTMMAVSCTKEEVKKETPVGSPIVLEKVSEEEAIEVITQSMESEKSGLDNQVSKSTTLASQLLSSPLCGIGFDTTIVHSQTTVTQSVNYTQTWNYQVNCIGSIPTDVTFSYNSVGTYTTLKMNSNDSASGSIVLTQLLPSDTNYSASINYTRLGSQESKIGKQNNFTSTITLSGSGVLINKTSNQIESGTLALNISGTAANGTTFTFGGTITFLGNQSATILLNNGNSYTIML